VKESRTCQIWHALIIHRANHSFADHSSVARAIPPRVRPLMYYLQRGSIARKIRARRIIGRRLSVRSLRDSGERESAGLCAAVRVHGTRRIGHGAIIRRSPPRNNRRKQGPNHGHRKEARPHEKESLTRVKATTKKSCHFFRPRQRAACRDAVRSDRN
jgi:hypothetical protein